MRVWHVVALAVAAGTAVPVALHHEQTGTWNVHQAGLAFFLWLNFIIALWEICLFLRVGAIEREHVRLRTEYRGRELDAVRRFFGERVTLSRAFSPTLWAGIWSSYSLFDESYADRKSFGFWVDTGNGFVTLVPTALFLYGMTFPLLPARVLGIVGLLVFYQMWYGTLVYFASFVFNKRYVGHTRGNLALFVGLSNGLWLTFPVWGMIVAITLVTTGSYGVLGR
jgi:hypothetical protein